MENVSFERHYVVQEEDHPSSYNIEETFGDFNFNLCRKEISRKSVRSVKHNDGTMKAVQENEVLFEKIDKDPMTVATTSTTLNQATTHNVTMLNEKLLQTKYENIKLKGEIIILREEMRKRRKVEA